MKRVPVLVLFLLLAHGAEAAQSNGNGALALAALIGARSPALKVAEKKVLARFLAGETAFKLPPGMRKITVKADKITCRLNDVAIVEHRCDLTFGAAAKTVSGEPAQALLATMIENGVASDGAAGTIYYSVAPIACTIDANEVQSNSGGGAECTFTNGP